MLTIGGTTSDAFQKYLFVSDVMHGLHLQHFLMSYQGIQKNF